MPDEVADSYDALAEKYAELFLGDLDHDATARRWLATFAELATQRDGIVADLGCGPGHVVNHLSELGLTAIGYDLSPGQIAQARLAFADLTFHEGDLSVPDLADASLGGIVSRYSIIHLHPSRLGKAFAAWMRVLEPDAPLLVSFFGSLTADAHGTPFDHTVVTAYELFPATIARQLGDAGFTDVTVDVGDPLEGGRPFSRGTILARKPGTRSN